MKKLKIMLLSFAVLAVVGSALAFNARTIKTFCTAPTNGLDPVSNDICTIPASGELKFCEVTLTSTTVNAGHGQLPGIWCTSTAQNLDGGGALNDCVVGNNKVRCLTAATIYVD